MKTISLILWVLFYFLDNVLYSMNVLILMNSNSPTFFIGCLCLRCHILETMAYFQYQASQRFTPMVSSKRVFFFFNSFFPYFETSLVAQTLKCLSTMRETWVQSLGREDPLEKGMAIHSSTIAWKIPWTEEPGRLQSMGSQRVRHD